MTSVASLALAGFCFGASYSGCSVVRVDRRVLVLLGFVVLRIAARDRAEAVHAGVHFARVAGVEDRADAVHGRVQRVLRMHDHAADAFDDHLGLVGHEPAEIAVARAGHAHRELVEMALGDDVRRAGRADLVSPPSKPVRRTSLPPSTSSDSRSRHGDLHRDAPAVVGHEPVARLAFDVQRVVAHVGLDALDRGGAAFDDQRLGLADGDFQAGGAAACRWSRTSSTSRLSERLGPQLLRRSSRSSQALSSAALATISSSPAALSAFIRHLRNERPAGCRRACRTGRPYSARFLGLPEAIAGESPLVRRSRPLRRPCRTCDGGHTAQPPRIRAADSFCSEV